MGSADATTERRDVLWHTASAVLCPDGLSPFGWFEIDDKPGLLVGNVGSSLWPAFSRSRFFTDGEADGMDRWTASVVGPVSDMLGASVRYPFGGKVWPFQHYGRMACGMKQSPIGLLIHHQYGLWKAFRTVFIFDESFALGVPSASVHTCDACVDKPCLNTCPVGAFEPGNYDYVSCRSHIGGAEGGNCRNGGCLARHACPVGRAYAYERDQQAFHMAAFA